MTNLINNAARYTSRGGEIEVSCGVADEQAFITVSDNGIGIPRELQSST
ncbi:MAG: sensor histidine kinase [Deltaproteobacteria bacterium]